MGGRTTWGPNTIRYNISENDNAGNTTANPYAAGQSLGAISFAGPNPPPTPSQAYAYNNTFYSNITTSKASCAGFYSVPTSGLFANNLCIMSGQTSSVFLDGNGFSSAGVQFVSNGYVNLSSPTTFNVYSFPGNFGSLSSWAASVPGGEAGSTQAAPLFSGTPAPGACTIVASVGPQPCPSAYVLGAGSPYIGLGTNLAASPYTLTIGATDYYGNAIPNNTASGWNVGAYGGNN